MSPTLWRASLRHLAGHPWQTGLAVLGIALGVAVVVAIDITSASARRAFALSTESVVGRATHHVVGGPAGLADGVYRDVRLVARVRDSAPIVEGHAAAPDFPGRVFHVLGVDPLAERPFRPYLSSAGGSAPHPRRRGPRRPPPKPPPGSTAAAKPPLETPYSTALLTRPGAALLSADTARSLGLRPGETLAVTVGGARHAVTLVGVLEPADALSRQALESLLVMDIASAQEILGLAGRLSRIDLMVPAGPDGRAILARVATVLPPGAEVTPASTRAETAERMTRAFHVNLTALSLLALIVGAFLIYNTMAFSVVQRREAIGLLRALGVARREIFALLLAEALGIGALATALGLGAGALLALGLLGLVTRTINDLYFVLEVRALAVPAAPFLKGAALGLAATLVAALRPALEATSTPPRVTLTRSLLEAGWRRVVPRAAVVGVVLVAGAGGLLLLPTESLAASHAALFALVLGFACLTPAATVLLMRLLEPALARLGGTLGRMAARGVSRALSRTAVAVAALMVAIATAVGVSIMVESFRGTVETWLAGSLQADVYVAPPARATLAGRGATLDPDLVARLRALPGVAALGSQRSAVVPSALGPTRLVALGFEGRATRGFRFHAGRPEAVWRAWNEGAVIVSEPYARRHDLGVGATLTLRTDRGPHPFPVAGVFYDYASDQGTVMMSRATYDRFWDDGGVSGVALHAAPSVDASVLVDRARAVAGHAEVLVRSNRALREASLEVFDRTFAITSVLRLLAMLVAFIGVLSALMAHQLERTREFGVLRAQGITPRQLWALVTSETALMGLTAGLLALPVGSVLALVLVFVINRRAFGWTLEIDVGPALLLQGLALALLAALLAGLIPAARMARTPPAAALRGE